MATTQSQATPDIDEERALSRYIILVKTEDGYWDEKGTVEALNGYAARVEAVDKYGLLDKVRTGGLELVAVGERFWSPKKPTVEKVEKLRDF